MESRSFGFYSAIHTLIVIAVLAFAVAAQEDGWEVVLTPPEILDENKRTGELTTFEEHPDGSRRITRVTFFPGTDIPRSERIVTTSEGLTTISSLNLNKQGEAIASTEEMVAGTISYAESKEDKNWQGKQIGGSRWYFRQAEDGSIVGPKIEEYLSASTRMWKTLPVKPTPKLPVKQSPTVYIIHHPSRLNDAKKAERLLNGNGFPVNLHETPFSDENAESQRNIARGIYYYPASIEPESRKIVSLMKGIVTVEVIRAEKRKGDGDGPYVTLYLLDEKLGEKQTIPDPTEDSAPPRTNPAGDRKDDAELAPRAVPNSEAKNKIVESLERNYANAKNLADRPGYDDTEAIRLLKEMESIVAFAEAQILKEEAGGEPTGPRWRRLQDVKDKAEIDIRMLKERLKKMKPAPPPKKEGEIRWGETPDSLQLSEKIGKRFTFVCQASQGGVAGGSSIIFGDDPFTGSSGICASAAYAGLITTAGGKVTIEIGPLLGRYAGTTGPEDAPRYLKNNVVTYPWPSEVSNAFPAPKCSFTFVK